MKGIGLRTICLGMGSIGGLMGGDIGGSIVKIRRRAMGFMIGLMGAVIEGTG